MNVTLRKIGNSLGVIIPKEMLDRLGMKEGDVLDLESDEKTLHLKNLDEDFQRQMQAADVFMERYKIALKKLAE